jgi:pimeloyl-ACP methyl ester carboxylesterase
MTKDRKLPNNRAGSRWLLAISTMICAATTPPVIAQPYDPPEGSPAYWETPGFKNHTIDGPKQARGILFWSHGVSGTRVQWKSAPPKFIKQFANNGWDIVKINRNNLHECGWTCSGVKHVADLKSRAEKARAAGYKHVIAAGQSYGGAISLEAAATPGLIDVVIAAAPGHGSDACGSGTGAARIADSLTDDLVSTISAVKSPRIVLTMAEGDECMGFNNPTAALRRALVKIGKHFVFLDTEMPIGGHLAALTNQFDAWYG